MPCLSFLAVDVEKDIRDTALKALRGMIERLEKVDPFFLFISTFSTKLDRLVNRRGGGGQGQI